MPRVPIKLTVNGEPYEFDIDPRYMLLEMLREELEMRDTSLDCNSGNCGECMVLLDGSPVASCLVLAVDASGREIVTGRGLVPVAQFIAFRANWGLL